MSRQTCLKATLMALVLAIVGAYLFLVRYQPASTIPFSESPLNTAALPLGEISRGFRAEQLISIKLDSSKLEGLEDEPICVEMLLANYSNRPNSGHFAVELVVDDITFAQEIDASDVRDNAYRRICFDGSTSWVLFNADDRRIVLRGISSPPGAAVTAWTTTDLRAGRLVGVADRLASRSLVFRLSTQVVFEQGRRDALILIFLGALAVGTMFLASGPPRRRFDASAQNQDFQ